MRLPLIPVLVAYLVATYFLAGIPFGMVVVYGKDGIDVRKVGSGNIGTTNVARASGASAAALTLLLDAGKGFLATFPAKFIIPALVWAGDASPMAFGAEYDWVGGAVFLACIIGHVFSFYLDFKGGKGIAVGFGATLGLSWVFGLSLLGIFLAFVIPTRYVSLGSVMAAASVPVLGWFMLRPSITFTVLMVCVAAVVIWSHRENVGRLLAGNERKFAFKSEKDADGTDTENK